MLQPTYPVTNPIRGNLEGIYAKLGRPAYYQSEQPSDPKEGELWFDDAADALKIYNNAVWMTLGVGTTATFLGLTDTPNSYSGQAGKGVQVNSGADGLGFYEVSTASIRFIKLTDTPSSYAGASLKFVRVNVGANGLEFLNYSSSGAVSFLDLTDTPADYSGQAKKGVRVNAGADALEFYPTSTGWIIGEDHSAELNGATTSFTTSNVFIADKLAVYWNGRRLRKDTDYTEKGDQTGFDLIGGLASRPPIAGHELILDYIIETADWIIGEDHSVELDGATTSFLTAYTFTTNKLTALWNGKRLRRNTDYEEKADQSGIDLLGGLLARPPISGHELIFDYIKL